MYLTGIPHIRDVILFPAMRAEAQAAQRDTMTAGARHSTTATQAATRPRARVSGRLEWAIAWRYLRSRKGSRLLSFISVVAIGGVVVGVSALILIMGVMNGLQNDLRDKILVGSPDLRVLNYGAGSQDRRLADGARAR